MRCGAAAPDGQRQSGMNKQNMRNNAVASARREDAMNGKTQMLVRMDVAWCVGRELAPQKEQEHSGRREEQNALVLAKRHEAGGE